MKEYEEQLAALRKENFNLKLRVYFLEERLDVSNTPANQHNLIKKNIELKVSLEGLRREVSERKELLCAAARALEIVEAAASRKESDLLSQLSCLQEELCSLRESASSKKSEAVFEINTESTNSLGADDSVALYAAAFNLRPTPSELRSFNKQQTNSVVTVASCECRQLRSLLEAERESALQLRETLSERDQIIAKQAIKIEELSEISKQLDLEHDNSSLLRDSKQIDVEEEKEQLELIKAENQNAFQMVQGCLVRLRRMDKDNKSLKASLQRKEERILYLMNQIKRTGLPQLPRETIQSVGLTSDDSETGVVQQYKDLLESQDDCLSDFEDKLKKMLSTSSNSDLTKLSSLTDEKEMELLTSYIENQKEHLSGAKKECTLHTVGDKGDLEDDTSKDTGKTEHKNIQEILSSRLQEMAYFLDSLLSHRCVLGEDKRKKVERLLEQSLELPVGLKLDPEASRLMEYSFMDASTFSMSQSMKLDDLTGLFGHHFSLDETVQPLKTKDKTSADENMEQNLKKLLNHQEQVIDRLSNQLMSVRSRCICGSTAAEDSDDRFAPFNLKTSFCEYNKSCTRRHRPKSGKAKVNLNTTWHGSSQQPADHSESECWSEPDRNVSLARMGGPLEPAADGIPSSEEDCQCSLSCSRLSASPHKMTSDSIRSRDMENYIKLLTKDKCKADQLLEEATAKILSLQNELETNKVSYNVSMKAKQNEINSLTQKLDEAENAINQLTIRHQSVLEEFEIEKTDSQEKLSVAQSQVTEATEHLTEERKLWEQREKSYQQQIKDVTDASSRRFKEMQEKMESECVSRSRYESLRKEVDNAALQASQATLDRVLATEQRMRSDAEAERLSRCLTSAKVRLSELETHCAELQNRLVHLESWQGAASRSLSSPGPARSPARTASPDQGIDSDRLSSLELVEPIIPVDNYTSPDLASENVMLRDRLARTQHKLEGALGQLNAANSRKKRVQRAICQEIHKTHSVLRQVRDNLTSDP